MTFSQVCCDVHYVVFGNVLGNNLKSHEVKVKQGNTNGNLLKFLVGTEADRKPQLSLEISFVLLIVQAHRWQHPSTNCIHNKLCSTRDKAFAYFFVQNPIHEWTLVADCASEDILRWFFFIGDKFHHLVVIRVSVLFRKSSGSLGRGFL